MDQFKRTMQVILEFGEGQTDQEAQQEPTEETTPVEPTAPAEPPTAGPIPENFEFKPLLWDCRCGAFKFEDCVCHTFTFFQLPG